MAFALRGNVLDEGTEEVLGGPSRLLTEALEHGLGFAGIVALDGSGPPPGLGQDLLLGPSDGRRPCRGRLPTPAGQAAVLGHYSDFSGEFVCHDHSLPRYRVSYTSTRKICEMSAGL